MVESANATILGAACGAPMGNYTSDDEGLVSLAHIDGRRRLKVLCEILRRVIGP
jgi:hypothetical protein